MKTTAVVGAIETSKKSSPSPFGGSGRKRSKTARLARSNGPTRRNHARRPWGRAISVRGDAASLAEEGSGMARGVKVAGQAEREAPGKPSLLVAGKYSGLAGF